MIYIQSCEQIFSIFSAFVNSLESNWLAHSKRTWVVRILHLKKVGVHQEDLK